MRKRTVGFFFFTVEIRDNEHFNFKRTDSITSLNDFTSSLFPLSLNFFFFSLILVLVSVTFYPFKESYPDLFFYN